MSKWGNSGVVHVGGEEIGEPHMLPRCAKGDASSAGELSSNCAEAAERRLRAELTKDDFVLAGPEE